jgi:hypothetical protein
MDGRWATVSTGSAAVFNQVAGNFVELQAAQDGGRKGLADGQTFDERRLDLR